MNQTKTRPHKKNHTTIVIHVKMLLYYLFSSKKQKGEIMIPKSTDPETKTASILKTSPAIRTARLAIFSALSVVGSLIKIPSPVGSLAFDSFPGFFVALLFGPAEGALVSGLGHIATAATSGFPLGILHIPIAIGMALAAAAIGLLNKMHKSLGVYTCTCCRCCNQHCFSFSSRALVS